MHGNGTLGAFTKGQGWDISSALVGQQQKLGISESHLGEGAEQAMHTFEPLSNGARTRVKGPRTAERGRSGVQCHWCSVRASVAFPQVTRYESGKLTTHG